MKNEETNQAQVMLDVCDKEPHDALLEDSYQPAHDKFRAVVALPGSKPALSHA